MEDSLYQRRRVWDSKDTVARELQFLQPLNAADPQFARVMVGPRQVIAVADPSGVSLAASGSIMVNYTANSIVAGTWTQPPPGVGVLFENARAVITTGDNSGKLQITLPVSLALGPASIVETSPLMTTLPITFPAINGAYFHLTARIPVPPYLPTDGAFPNGPAAAIGIVNTDGAAPHTYIRRIAYFYRYIYDVDFSKEKVYVMGTLA